MKPFPAKPPENDLVRSGWVLYSTAEQIPDAQSKHVTLPWHGWDIYNIRQRMTREELARRIYSFERDNRKMEWPILAILIAGLVIPGLIAARYAHDSPTTGLVCLAAIVAALFLPSFVLGRINKKRLISLNLHCPSCGCGLTGPIGRLAVTTLYCSQCGKQIVDEGDDE